MRNKLIRGRVVQIGLLAVLAACSGGKNLNGFRATWHDQGVKSAVRLQLMRDDRVQARHVKIAVRHGQVTLSGHVRSAAERLHAEEHTRRVNGVAAVENRIEVMDRSTIADRNKVAAPIRTATVPVAQRPPAAAQVESDLAVSPVKKSPVIAKDGATEGGYIDRGMLPPSKSVAPVTRAVPAAAVTKKSLPAAVAPAKTPAPTLQSNVAKMKSTMVPAPSAKPQPATAGVGSPTWWQRSPVNTAAPTGLAEGADDSLAQEAAAELQRLKQGH